MKLAVLHDLPFGKLTWQWKMDQLKMYSLLKMGIFHCHVSLLEGNPYDSPCIKSKMYLDISSFTNIPKPTVPGCASGLHADSCGAGASRIRFSPFLSTCSTKNVNGCGVHDYQCFHKCWTTIWNDMETLKSTKSRKANLSHGFNSPKKWVKRIPSVKRHDLLFLNVFPEYLIPKLILW